MDIHSFNTQVATDYNIEKAILLHNIYFWCKKNEANNVNIYNGKAYTYNTAEAFAMIFPYMTPRKIAETLRQMEAEGLLYSIQNKGTNRVKSYTTTEKAEEYYITLSEVRQKEEAPAEPNIQKTVSSNIQNNVRSNIPKTDNGTYQNETMEHTNFKHCSITDINNRYKQQIGEAHSATPPAPAKKKKPFIKPSKEEIQNYCNEKQYQYVNVNRFYDYYEEQKWKVYRGGKLRPMSNWKQAVKNWNEREIDWGKKPQNSKGDIWGKENNCGAEYAQIFDELQKE